MFALRFRSWLSVVLAASILSPCISSLMAATTPHPCAGPTDKGVCVDPVFGRGFRVLDDDDSVEFTPGNPAFTISFNGEVPFAAIGSESSPNCTGNQCDKLFFLPIDVADLSPGERDPALVLGPYKFGSLDAPTTHTLTLEDLATLLEWQSVSSNNSVTAIAKGAGTEITDGSLELFVGLRFKGDPSPPPPPTGKFWKYEGIAPKPIVFDGIPISQGDRIRVSLRADVQPTRNGDTLLVVAEPAVKLQLASESAEFQSYQLRISRSEGFGGPQSRVSFSFGVATRTAELQGGPLDPTDLGRLPTDEEAKVQFQQALFTLELGEFDPAYQIEMTKFSICPGEKNVELSHVDGKSSLQPADFNPFAPPAIFVTNPNDVPIETAMQAQSPFDVDDSLAIGENSEARLQIRLNYDEFIGGVTQLDQEASSRDPFGIKRTVTAVAPTFVTKRPIFLQPAEASLSNDIEFVVRPITEHYVAQVGGSVNELGVDGIETPLLFAVTAHVGIERLLNSWDLHLAVTGVAEAVRTSTSGTAAALAPLSPHQVESLENGVTKISASTLFDPEDLNIGLGTGSHDLLFIGITQPPGGGSGVSDALDPRVLTFEFLKDSTLLPTRAYLRAGPVCPRTKKTTLPAFPAIDLGRELDLLREEIPLELNEKLAIVIELGEEVPVLQEAARQCPTGEGPGGYLKFRTPEEAINQRTAASLGSVNEEGLTKQVFTDVLLIPRGDGTVERVLADCRSVTLLNSLAVGDGAGAGTAPQLTWQAEPDTDYFLLIQGATPNDTGLITLEVTASPSAGPRIRPGDCNTDGELTLTDAVCLLGFLFIGNPDRLPCGDGTLAPESGNRELFDSNGDGDVALADAVFVLNFLFIGSAPHTLGRDCTQIAGCPDACPAP